MSRARVRVSSLLISMAVALLAGCATSAPPPPAMTLQAGDVKSLAGEWAGSVTGSRSGTFDGPSIAGTVSIKEDGTFTSNLGGQPGTGTFRIVDGKAVYEGANMRGTATLHGSGAEQVLMGQGTWVGSTGQSKFELRRTLSRRLASGASGHSGRRGARDAHTDIRARVSTARSGDGEPRRGS